MYNQAEMDHHGMNCVVVGGGAAGIQAALSCRRHWPKSSVTLVDREEEVGYYRTLLPQFMVETITEKKLFFFRPQEDPWIRFKPGRSISSIDRARCRVQLSTIETLDYDRLILACGGQAIVPAVCPGTACRGVFPVRGLAGARDARKWLPGHRRVVVLGGGLVGVKTAAHLAHAGFQVTLVERERTVLPLALSADAAFLVARHLQDLGIELVMGASVEDARSEKEQIKAVLAGGRWFECDTLLVAAGSRPDIAFLDDSGLLDEGRLTVSPALQTRDERIFAAGDAIHIEGRNIHTPWTWPQAVSQGILAGANCFSDSPSPLNDLTRVNAMNLFGLSLAILGPPVPGAERIFSSRPQERVYREFFLLGDRIVGGALVGDVSGAGTIHSHMVSGIRIDRSDPELPGPKKRVFDWKTWRDAGQQTRACFLSAKG